MYKYLYFFSNFLTKLFTFENFSFHLYFNYINDSWLLITCTSNIFLGNLARAKGQMLVLTSPFTYGARSRNVGRSILFITEFEERGVRKITTGITGLWRPSVHSDVAFWSFDVGSSYHCEAEFAKLGNRASSASSKAVLYSSAKHLNDSAFYSF